MKMKGLSVALGLLLTLVLFVVTAYVLFITFQASVQPAVETGSDIATTVTGLPGALGAFFLV